MANPSNLIAFPLMPDSGFGTPHKYNQKCLPNDQHQVQLLVFFPESFDKDSEYVFIDNPGDAIVLVHNFMEVGSLYLNQLARLGGYD